MKNQSTKKIIETPLALLTRVLLVRLRSLITGSHVTEASVRLIDNKKLVSLHDRLQSTYDAYLTKTPRLQKELRKKRKEKVRKILQIHEKYHAKRLTLKAKQQKEGNFDQKTLDSLEELKDKESVRMRLACDTQISKIMADLKSTSENLEKSFEAANKAYETLYLLLLEAIKKDESDILHLAPGELGKTRAKVVIQVR